MNHEDGRRHVRAKSFKCQGEEKEIRGLTNRAGTVGVALFVHALKVEREEGWALVFAVIEPLEYLFECVRAWNVRVCAAAPLQCDVPAQQMAVPFQHETNTGRKRRR